MRGTALGKMIREKSSRKGNSSEKMYSIQEKTMLILQTFPLKLLKHIQRDDCKTVFVSLGVEEKKTKGKKADWFISSNKLRA